MSDAGEGQPPKNRSSFSNRRPKSPRDADDSGNSQLKTVYLLEPVAVKDLAVALHLKPFKVVADLMEIGLFKTADEFLDFKTATAVARKHGYRAEKPPPGMLVL